MVNYEPFQWYGLCDGDWPDEEESLADQLAAEAIAEDAAENLEEK